MSDLTHAEANAAFRAFVEGIGPKATYHVGLESHYRGSALQGAIYPDGILGNARMEVLADSYRDLLSKCEASWRDRLDVHRAATVRAMALEIITQTADQGECTDAALRAKFSFREVDEYGEAACAQACEMASNGPFSIVALKGANAA